MNVPPTLALLQTPPGIRVMPALQRFVAAWIALVIFARPLAAADPQQIEFFEKKVRPLLATHCYECHSVQSKSLKAGFRVDSRSAVLKGGDTGPAVSMEKPEDSLLLKAVRYEDYEMPPKGKLPAGDIQILEQWVRMGAPWPDGPEPAAESAPPPFDLAARKAAHWCWQPIKTPALPDIKDASW
ncbi:MAG TPA: c-type cytochrome domain-containing protein, partial [Caulifigura sp.]|nr:c-type cytochrome domain-containing protein [Caulifigura sp.]